MPDEPATSPSDQPAKTRRGATKVDFPPHLSLTMAAQSGGRDGDSTAHPKPLQTPKATAPTADPETTIRFRLSDINHYMERTSSPSDHRVSPFLPKGERLFEVPVFRIFGATDQGQRVAAFVHGAFPYLYIEYKGSLNPEVLNAYILKLGFSLNRAMDLTQKQRDEKKKRSPQYIAFVLPCKGVPIYGYQVGYKVYLKIYYVNPRLGRALAEVLRGGAIMNTKFDLYEDHIPFHLQFMLDANLYGSGWVEVSADCRFRNPLPDEGPTSSIYNDPPTCTGPYGIRTYTTSTVPSHLLHPSSGPSKDTHCPIELDFPLHAIRNRRKLIPRDIHHDFVEYLQPELIKEGKLVKSLEELWKDEERRRAAQGLDPPEEIKDTAPRQWDERDEKDPLWAVEPELRKKIEEVAAKSLQNFRTKVGVQKDPMFGTYVDDLAKMNKVERGFLSRIRTSFEQVEGLFEERLRLDEQHQYEYGAWAPKGLGINVAKDAEAGDAASRARQESAAPYEINDARLKATQAIIDKFKGDEMSDLSGGEESDDDGESVRAMSEGVDRDQDLDDFDSDLDDDQEDDAEGSKSGSPERARSTTLEADAEEDFCEPAPKRLKRSQSADAILRSSSPAFKDDFTGAVDFAASFRAPPPAQKASPRNRPPPRNPFTSPNKAARSRRATASSPPPAPIDSDDEGAALLSLRDEPDELEADPSDFTPETDVEMAPPQAQQVELDPMELEELEKLSPSAFEYQPTPTQVDDSVPDNLPAHLRSSTKAAYDLPAASFDSASSGEGAMPPPMSSSEHQPSAPHVEPAPTKRRVTFQVAASDSDSDHSDWSEASNPIERLPVYASQQSASSSTSSAPAPQLRPSQYPRASNAFVFAAPPPSIAEVIASMEPHGQTALIYKDPYFAFSSDIPSGKSGERKMLRWEHAGRRFDIKDAAIRNLPLFEHGGVAVDEHHSERRARWRSWEYAPRPPTAKEMEDWLVRESSGDLAKEKERRCRQLDGHNIDAATQKDGGFKFTAINGAPSQKEPQHMALLAMELHTNTRGKLLPDPKYDEIVALFYCLKTENEDIVFNGRSEDTHVGVIAVGDDKLKALLGHTDYVLKIVDSESELINEFIDMVRTWDPECVAGYEVHHGSWGYLIERALYGHEWSITPDLGRVKRHDQGRHGDAKSDRWGFTQSSTLNFTGRHVLPIWRILKADNKMQHNTFEHVAYHVLRQRTPHFSFETLTKWHTSGIPHRVARVFDYWRNRVEMGVEMLDAAETIEQNCETARVFGVDFRSVRTRGSQFKVESVLFKLSKPESFMMLSPSRCDVGRQNAAECQPLIMEPQSAFYKGPLVVLDFTSLYPSVVIAYNYCWSTCLGRVNEFKGKAKLGTTELEHPPGLWALLEHHVNVSPNGMVFAKPYIRKSLMAKMVSELLDTRVMVKASMKKVSGDRALTKLLNARQLALKFLANVTYGYIGATFSGRMPCVEVADAIVQTGRETLEKALETIHANKEWGAKVVYGDTDSLFVYLPGKTKEDAFRIGNEMANTVTSMNPRPMKLKFEKVYLPCVLVAKKRYVGYKFERLSDTTPELEVKGLEVIRRDGTPATQKMQETTLRILFDSSNLSAVKEYCQRQWKKILAGDASPQDFIIAKKVKLGSYSENRDPPPGATVAARAMELDPRGEPEHGERVPYILIQAEPGTKQVNRALDPHEYLADPNLQYDAEHYITRAILKPLARIFNLAGVDIERWWKEMPRVKRLNKVKKNQAAKTRLEGHFNSSRCEICLGDHAEGGICDACKTEPGEVAYTVMNRVRQVEIKQRSLHQICASCSSTRDEEGIACDSIDCPIMWERASVKKEMGQVEQLKELIAW